MATQQELIDIVAQVRGEDQLKNLAAAMRYLNEKILDLGPNIAATDPIMQRHAEDLVDVKQKYAELSEQMKKVPAPMAETTKVTNAQIKAMGMLADRMSDLGNNGIRGLLRNLGTIDPMFLVIGAGIDVLIRHWGDLEKAFNFHIFEKQVTVVETLKTRIDELNKKEYKVSADRSELNDLEAQLKRITKAQEAFNAIANIKTKAERQSEQAIDEALAEAPGGAKVVRDKLAAQEAKRVDQEGGSPLAAARKAMADFKERSRRILGPGFESHGGYQDDLKIYQEKIQKELDENTKKVNQNIGKLMGPAEAGDAAGHNERLAKALDSAGLSELARKIRDATPEMINLTKAAKDADEALWDMGKAADKAQHEKQKQADDEGELEYQHGEEWRKEQQDITKRKAASNANAEAAELQAGAFVRKLNKEEQAKADKERKDEIRENEKEGGRAAGSPIGNFARKQAELALAQNPDLDPANAASLAATAAYRGLQGAVGADGQKLTPEQREAASKKIGAQAVEAYNKKVADVSRLNLDASTANATVTELIINEMDQISAGLRQLRAQQERNMRAMIGPRGNNRRTL